MLVSGSDTLVQDFTNRKIMFGVPFSHGVHDRILWEVTDVYSTERRRAPTAEDEPHGAESQEGEDVKELEDAPRHVGQARGKYRNVYAEDFENDSESWGDQDPWSQEGPEAVPFSATLPKPKPTCKPNPTATKTKPPPKTKLPLKPKPPPKPKSSKSKDKPARKLPKPSGTAKPKRRKRAQSSLSDGTETESEGYSEGSKLNLGSVFIISD